MFPGYRQFQQATPVRHLVIDDALPVRELEAIQVEWDRQAGWEGPAGHRRTNCPQGAAVDRLLKLSFVKSLENISGIGGLISDDTWHQGGLYEDGEGYREHVHITPTVHPECESLACRLCVILYLTPTNQLTGELEFWKPRGYAPYQCERIIRARYNRLVIFETTVRSWHGHTTPLRWNGMHRRYVKAYYYSPGLPLGHVSVRKTINATWT